MEKTGIRLLQVIHLLIFIAGVSTVTILHIKIQNFWDFLRLPQLISDLNPLFGFGYPAPLHIYQSILIFALIVAFVNSLGLVFYKSKLWRFTSDLSSFLGVLIIWPVSLFLLFTLASAENLSTNNIQTIAVYFSFTFTIAILDLVTWFADEESFLKRIRKK